MKIRISALRSIVDLLLLFGFQLLSDKPVALATPASHSPGGPEEEEEEEKGDAAEEDTAQSILLLLSDFLDGEVGGRESLESNATESQRSRRQDDSMSKSILFI